MKRRIAVVLAGVMALSMLAACGGKKTTASNEEGNADNFKMKSTLNWVVTVHQEEDLIFIHVKFQIF